MQRSADGMRLRRGDVRVFHLSENLRFTDEHRIEARADAEEMLDGALPEMGVQVRFEIVTRLAVTEVRKKGFELGDAAFVVRQFGVDFQTAARLQHHRFTNRLVVSQCHQRLRHSTGGKSMALADF